MLGGLLRLGSLVKRLLLIGGLLSLLHSLVLLLLLLVGLELESLSSPVLLGDFALLVKMCKITCLFTCCL